MHKIVITLGGSSINHLLWWFRFSREKKPRGKKSQKVVDDAVFHCDDAHCDKDDCMGCRPEPRRKCRVPRTTKKKKQRRRRRRRKAPCGVACTPCKEQKCPGRCIVRIPLKARLSGCTFRDYLFLTFPGYRSLEGVLILYPSPSVLFPYKLPRYMCGPTVGTLFPTPHTNLAVGADHELSYLGSNCNESWRLLVQV